LRSRIVLYNDVLGAEPFGVKVAKYAKESSSEGYIAGERDL